MSSRDALTRTALIVQPTRPAVHAEVVHAPPVIERGAVIERHDGGRERDFLIKVMLIAAGVILAAFVIAAVFIWHAMSQTQEVAMHALDKAGEIAEHAAKVAPDVVPIASGSGWSIPMDGALILGALIVSGIIAARIKGGW